MIYHFTIALSKLYACDYFYVYECLTLHIAMHLVHVVPTEARRHLLELEYQTAMRQLCWEPNSSPHVSIVNALHIESSP